MPRVQQIIRTAYLLDRKGNIYEATLNIANGRDRKILYEINRVHKIDKIKSLGKHTDTGEGQRSRYQEPKSGRTQSEAVVSVAEKQPAVNPRSMGDDRWMYEDGVRLPTAEDTRPFGISDEDVGAQMDAMRRERDGIMLPRADGNTNSDGIMLPRADDGYYDSMLGEAENSPDWMGRRPGVNRTNRTAPEETEVAFTADDIDEYEQYTREINRPVEPKAVYDADLETLPKKAQNYLERTERGRLFLWLLL